MGCEDVFGLIDLNLAKSNLFVDLNFIEVHKVSFFFKFGFGIWHLVLVLVWEFLDLKFGFWVLLFKILVF